MSLNKTFPSFSAGRETRKEEGKDRPGQAPNAVQQAVRERRRHIRQTQGSKCQNIK